MGVSGELHAPSALTPEKTPVPIECKSEWAANRSGSFGKYNTVEPLIEDSAGEFKFCPL
jgi:hypothetical protein